MDAQTARDIWDERVFFDEDDPIVAEAERVLDSWGWE